MGDTVGKLLTNPSAMSLAGTGIGAALGGPAGGAAGASLAGGGGAASGMIPGVSDSAMADMMGSMNPGSGIGAADVAGGGIGSAPGLISQSGGGLSSLLGNKDFQGLAGMFTPQQKPKGQAPASGSINPPKSIASQAPAIVGNQQMVNRGNMNSKNGSSRAQPDLQELMQLLKMMK